MGSGCACGSSNDRGSRFRPACGTGVAGREALVWENLGSHCPYSVRSNGSEFCCAARLLTSAAYPLVPPRLQQFLVRTRARVARSAPYLGIDEAKDLHGVLLEAIKVTEPLATKEEKVADMVLEP